MKIIYTILMALCVVMPASAQKMNILKKIFVHPIAQTANELELGNIIFYFEQDQMVNMLKKQYKGDREERIYFFPMADIAADAATQEMVRQLTAIKHDAYSVSLVPTKKPIPGIQFIIQYDPERVDITYNSFKSLNLKEGIIFRFCDKKVLAMLQSKYNDTPLLQTVMGTGHKRVMIDCGHGGSDEGAVYDGIKEKDINLTIGLLVAQALKKKGVTPLLTRNDDVTVSLKERIDFANSTQPDLFVSIHANAAANAYASGVETFGSVPLSIGHSDSYDIAHRLVTHRVDTGMIVAQAIHTSLMSYLQKINPEVKDRRVKRAPLLVLLGTTMPSTLVEVGFVSNPDEARRLMDTTYQRYIALGIADGICNYLQKVV